MTISDIGAAAPARLTPRRDRLAVIATELGKTHTYAYAILAVAAVDARSGLVLAAAITVSEVVNAGLKHLFRRARPADMREPFGRKIEGRYSFPSAHAQDCVLFWGMLFLRADSGAARAGCVALIALICWARIHLRQHFASDVAGGIVVGGLLLAAVARLGYG